MTTEEVTMTTEEIMKLADTYQYSIATGDRFNFAKGADAFRGIQTVLNLGILSSPLNQGTIRPSDPDSPSSNSEIASCTSVYKLDEVLKAAATVTGSYGGASGSVAASYSRNISISETSSSYIAFFRKSLGRVHINPDAKLTDEAAALLRSNAHEFINKYGRVYVSAYRLSSQFFGEVKIDAASMSDKIKMDVAVKASYKTILKVNSTFESDLQKSSAKYSMSVSAAAMGTNVPYTGISSVKDMAEVVKKIELENDPRIATITEVTLSSWLHLADFTKNVRNEDIALFTPKMSPAQLDQHDDNYERIRWMAKFTEDCLKNLDAKLVRQWKVNDKAEREGKLMEARAFATEWIDKLSKITEDDVIAPDFIKNLAAEISKIQLEKILPALKIIPFRFIISLDVASDYDGYHPVAFYDMLLKVDPNENISTVEQVIDVDNHHSNCRHFHGHQHALYTDGSQGRDGTVVKPRIDFFTWWDRTCGSTGFSNRVSFTDDVENHCQLDYNSTVRVRLKYRIVFGNLQKLPSGLDDGNQEEEYVYYA